MVGDLRCHIPLPLIDKAPSARVEFECISSIWNTPHTALGVKGESVAKLENNSGLWQ